MLDNNQIQEFKDIYFKEYGIKLSSEDAVKKATALFNLFKQFSKLNHNTHIDIVSLG